MTPTKEPLVSAGIIVTVVAAILVFLQEFGVNLTDGQQDSIKNLVAVLAPIILAFIARGLVFSPATVDKVANDQYLAGVNNDPQPNVGPPPTGK